jgi:hypothetical protein
LADVGETSTGPVGTIDDAVMPLRFGGYCAYCDRIVERRVDGSCPEGHPAGAVTGRIVLVEGDELPQLPPFNLAAFLIPPIWGPAHGQWVGALFLPIWLFMDSIISKLGGGPPIAKLAVTAVVGCTLAFMAFFAKHANGLGWRRVSDHLTVDEYAARERIWAIASIPAAALLLGWALWFHLVFEAAAH